MNIFLISIFSFTLCYSNNISTISDNMSYFYMKDSGSFINQNKRDSIFSNNIYDAKLISYPNGITFKSFNINCLKNNFEISSSMKILNYGQLTDSMEEYDASEQIIDFTIINNITDSNIVGVSMAYALSWIGNYMQSSMIYNIGLQKTIFKNHLSLGLSLQDYTYIINSYSNFEESNNWSIKLSSMYQPSYLPLSLYLDYIYNYHINDEFIFALKMDYSTNFSVLFGKSYYINSIKLNDNILSHFSVGAQVRFKKFIFKLGLQYIEKGFLSIGSGISTEFR